MLLDFIGFSFDGVHSSELNILRVSDGNRYTETLTPQFENITAQMPGSDTTLCWDSYYSNTPFTIDIAFDSLTEIDLRSLRQTFNAKRRGVLVFDERPYKAYDVVLQGPVQLTTLCFEENGERIYKGEGTIVFVSYYPYARSVHKFLDEYDDTIYTNKYEWASASGLRPSKGTLDGTGTQISLYNAGDVPADWVVYYSINASGCALTQINLDNRPEIMQFSAIARENASDSFVRINSRTQLIEGCDSNKVPTGSTYNKYLKAGDFFKLPLNTSTFVSNTACAGIEYDYLYY